MAQYRKKPVVIEAVQYTGANADEVFAFVPGVSREPGDNGDFLIHTLEGTMRAQPGDWLIKGVKGEFYPCKSDVFALTYEKVPV